MPRLLSNILRFAWAIFTWTAYQILHTALSAFGLLLVPLAIKHGRSMKSPVTGEQIFNAPRWLWLYGNDQEGFDAPLAFSLHPTWKLFWRRYAWAALRNRVNNLRFVTWLHPPPVPSKIRFVSGWRWWLCWQGPLYGFRYNKKSGAAFKIGWRYNPIDRDGIKPDDWRRLGCGFTLRLNVR